MSRRHLAILLVLGALVVLGIQRSRMQQGAGAAAPHPAAPVCATEGSPSASARTGVAAGAAQGMGMAPLLPPVAHRQAPLPRGGVASGCFSADQARAFAAAGLAQDGKPHSLLQLDDAARAVLPRMQRLMAAQVPILASSRIHAPADAQRLSTALTPEQGGPDRGITAALDLSQVDRGVRGDADGVRLTSDQVWALARLDPSRGRLTLVNESTGGYVVSLSGSDFGTIRVDGGLVVPGRSYLVHGTMVITGAASCAIQIRPAATAATVYAPSGPATNG